MSHLNLRYRPTDQEKEILNKIVAENPFFKSREILKFLLGFYVNHAPNKLKFRQKRLQAMSRSFEVTAASQPDDTLIDTNKKLKLLVF